MEINGTTYPSDLPKDVALRLDNLRQIGPYGARVRVTYNGWSQTGYLGRSTGAIKTAMICHNRRSLGGELLFTGITRIEYANKSVGGAIWTKPTEG